MSTSEASELQADLESRTRLVPESDSSKPFQLNPVALTSPNRRGKLQQAKPLLQVTQFPLLKQQLESLGEKFPIEGEDVNLVKIENLGVKGSRKDVVTLVCRTKQRNRLDNKVGEFIVYYTMTSATDKKHEPLTGYLQYGKDYQVELTPQFDADGEELDPLIGQRYEVYTIPYSKDTLQKILTENEVFDKCQFNCDIMNQSHGGYTAEELLELSIEELAERGRLARTGSPTDLLFTSLSPKERMFLQFNKGQ